MLRSSLAPLDPVLCAAGDYERSGARRSLRRLWIEGSAHGEALDDTKSEMRHYAVLGQRENGELFALEVARVCDVAQLGHAPVDLPRLSLGLEPIAQPIHTALSILSEEERELYESVRREVEAEKLVRRGPFARLREALVRPAETLDEIYPDVLEVGSLRAEAVTLACEIAIDEAASYLDAGDRAPAAKSEMLREALRQLRIVQRLASPFPAAAQIVATIYARLEAALAEASDGEGRLGRARACIESGDWSGAVNELEAIVRVPIAAELLELAKAAAAKDGAALRAIAAKRLARGQDARGATKIALDVAPGAQSAALHAAALLGANDLQTTLAFLSAAEAEELAPVRDEARRSTAELAALPADLSRGERSARERIALLGIRAMLAPLAALTDEAADALVAQHVEVVQVEPDPMWRDDPYAHLAEKI